jgi:hypothetical protein
LRQKTFLQNKSRFLKTAPPFRPVLSGRLRGFRPAGGARRAAFAPEAGAFARQSRANESREAFFFHTTMIELSTGINFARAEKKKDDQPAAAGDRSRKNFAAAKFLKMRLSR